MAISITQRLTGTIALLVGLIVLSLGVLYSVSIGGGIENKSLEKARQNLLEVREAILVDFSGRRIEFDELHVPFDHWTVVRANQQVEGGRGIFRRQRGFTLGSGAELRNFSEDEHYALASRPLIEEKAMAWEEIPSAAQQAASSHTPEGAVFINAKREVEGQFNVIAIRWLTSDHVFEIAVTDQGEYVLDESDPLPA